MSERADNLAAIQERIAAAAKRAGRSHDDVTLLAVSKTWPAVDVAEVVEAGQKSFGESRLQEGQVKVPELGEHLDWHFIGQVQRNKVRKILPLFPTIHSVSSLRLANFIDRVAGELGLRPSIYLEINLAGEDRKGGFTLKGLKQDLPELRMLENMTIKGLMCLPPKSETAEDTRPWFVKLRETRDALEKEEDLKLPGLSMGMSGDFEVAIEEGSTIVRVGSAIFGKRPPWNPNQ